MWNTGCGFGKKMFWPEAHMLFSTRKCEINLMLRVAGLAQWWERSPSTISMCPGFDSRARRHMWVEFVVGSVLCSERFFSGYSGFPLSLKTNISNFQFYPEMHGHFWTSSCELLSAPWVNKLHLKQITFTTNCIYMWSEQQQITVTQWLHDENNLTDVQDRLKPQIN